MNFRRFIVLTLFCPLLTGCLDRFASAPPPSSTPLQNFISTLAPTASASFTVSPTLAPTATRTLLPAPTKTPTPQPSPPAPTQETILPTFTIDPYLLVSGPDVWRLTALEKRHALEDLGFLLTPYQFNHSPRTYQFLTFVFECTTGTSLLKLLGGSYSDLSYANKISGFLDVYVTDRLGRKFLATMISTCWLAAPVPKDSSGYTLYFKNLAPFVPAIVARTIHRTPTPEIP